MLDEHGLSHRKIKPHCPEENGLIERAQRTIAEALEGEELQDYLQASRVIGKVIRWYNEERLHSALGFLCPVDYYRGSPEEFYAIRRLKLAQARHRRREQNLQIRQPTLPFTSEESVAKPDSRFVPHPLKQNIAGCLYSRFFYFSKPQHIVVTGVKGITSLHHDVAGHRAEVGLAGSRPGVPLAIQQDDQQSVGFLSGCLGDPGVRFARAVEGRRC